MAPDARPALARVQSLAVTRASLPGRPPALCVPSLFLIVSKLLHRTCIFLTHSKVKSATLQVHALPLDPVPVYFPSRTRHPHAFSPRRARGSGSARGHSRVRVTSAVRLPRPRSAALRSCARSPAVLGFTTPSRSPPPGPCVCRSYARAIVPPCSPGRYLNKDADVFQISDPTAQPPLTSLTNSFPCNFPS